jgi:hypothetical protein
MLNLVNPRFLFLLKKFRLITRVVDNHSWNLKFKKSIDSRPRPNNNTKKKILSHPWKGISHFSTVLENVRTLLVLIKSFRTFIKKPDLVSPLTRTTGGYEIVTFYPKPGAEVICKGRPLCISLFSAVLTPMNLGMRGKERVR